MQTHKSWTEEEEEAFIEILERMVKEHLWAMAKSDERIAHRGCAGVRAHMTAMVSHSSGRVAVDDFG